MKIDFTPTRETTTLLKPSKPKFFPRVNVDLQHFQLKHRISTRYADTIYYCSGHELYALHINSQKRELIKSLSSEPKCLDAAHGWICAAADEGKCFFINIAGDHEGQFQAGSHHRRAEVDDLLPLDLDPASRSLAIREDQYLTPAGRRAAKYVLHKYALGSSLVNSVTIHEMQSSRSGLDDEVVVLLTNNDETVRIFSLSQLKPLVTLTYPTAMNHASISPDGNLLLAVGDKGQAFFHGRVPFENSAVVGDKVFSTFGWIAIAEPLLPQTALSDQCFCTAFSPSGHRCVVASQGGTIIVYDTSLITQEMDRCDAVTCVMRTSRPSSSPQFIGAARSMSFSPSPWDLLVVAEDQGRVVVLDTRDPEFMVRQTLDLNTDPSDVVTTDFTEAQDALQQRQIEIEARVRREATETQNYLAAMTNTANRLEAAADSVLTGEARSFAQQSARLTESQRRTIESFAGALYPQANDARLSNSMTSPIAINQRPSLSDRGYTIGTLPSAEMPGLARSAFARDHANVLSTDTDRMPHPTLLTDPALIGRDHQIARTASISEYLQQRNIERERQRTSDRQPRRRGSVVISNSRSRSTHNNPPTLAPIGTSTPTLSTSPSRIPSDTSSHSSPAPEANRNDTSQPSHGPYLTVDDLLRNFEDWQTTSIGTISPVPNNDRSNHYLVEAATVLSRAHREGSISSSGHSTTDMRPARTNPFTPAANNTSTATADARYQQTMQSLLARIETARNETTRNEPARNEAPQARNHPSEVLSGRLVRGMPRVRDRIGTHPEAGDIPTIINRAIEGSQSRAGGVVVQGVGWSHDGSSLFVATEKGLLQFEINIRERMQWPGDALV